jgi:hypothetical protein
MSTHFCRENANKSEKSKIKKKVVFYASDYYKPALSALCHKGWPYLSFPVTSWLYA